MNTTDDELRAWAKSIYPLEAATELLIRTGHAHRYTRHDADTGRPWLDFTDAAADVWPGGALSGGERALIAVAVSLSDVVPTFTAAADRRPFPDSDATSWWAAFSLAETIPRIDRKNLDLVLAAIAHAGGSHDHHPDPFLIDDAGEPHLNPDRRDNLPSLHPWPKLDTTTTIDTAWPTHDLDV
jgi:hypothetical protein